jgi:hypothetical protein
LFLLARVTDFLQVLQRSRGNAKSLSEFRLHCRQRVAGNFGLAMAARKRKLFHLRNVASSSKRGNAMSRSITGPAGSASRRAILLNTVSIAAGGFILSAPPARSALAQTKLTHEAAKYQETPKNNQKCSTCVQFMAPASCKIVADPINPNGWCQFYGAKTG